MRDEAVRFNADFSSCFPKRWLSFLGGSGTGKTFLSQMIFERAKQCPHLTKHRELLAPVSKVFWPKLLTHLRCGEYERLRDACDANFLFIDEIAIEHDPRGFARDKLCELISSRVGMWTLITSNLTLEKIAEMDTRISSRMIRCGSRVVECDTVDFSLRPK